MAISPFIRGRNGKLLLNIDGSNVTVRVKRFAVEENVTEVVDDVCGEDRSRPDIVTNFFELGFEAFQDDMTLANKWLAMLVPQDAQTAPLVVTVGLTYNMRNGTKQSYMGTQCTRRALKIDAASRSEAVMFPSGFRARYFKSTQ